jgi:hypothetical protein
MNNYNSTSNGKSGHSQGVRAEPLYTTSPDAVQRLRHEHFDCDPALFAEALIIS